MNICIISQFYPPEIGAAASRIYDFKTNLSKKDKVIVLTSIPKYLASTKKYDSKISAFRVRTFFSPDKGFISRGINYFSFVLNSIFKILFTKKIRKSDIFFISSPPLTIGLISIFLKKILKKKVVLDIRDVWPESLVSMNVLSNRFIIKILEKLEISIYKNSDYIVTTTGFQKKNIEKKGIKESKIKVIENGVDEKLFFKSRKDFKLIKEYGLENKKVLLYLGNHGVAQDLRIILKNAKSFDDSIFLFIGEGEEKKLIKSYCKDKKITNVKFIDRIDRKQAPAYINLADICIINLKKDKTFDEVIPAKIFEYLSCEKPIIVPRTKQLSELMKKAKVGITFKFGNSNDFSIQLKKLLKDPKLSELGKNGRKFIINNFTRSNKSEKLKKIFVGLIK